MTSSQRLPRLHLTLPALFTRQVGRIANEERSRRQRSSAEVPGSSGPLREFANRYCNEYKTAPALYEGQAGNVGRGGGWWKRSMRDWSDPKNYLPSWDNRAAEAAKFIPERSRVLDIGCGRMAVRGFLPPGCSYIPADLTRWTEDTIQVDLNAGQFPEGTYDVIVMLGVLEYLNDVPAVLAKARVHASRLITSYNHPRPFLPIRRRKRRAAEWVNDFRVREFARMLKACGWSTIESHPLGDNPRQRVYSAS